MRSERDHRERGTTLVESLFALLLFALVASAIGHLLTQQIRMEGWNVERTTATALAEQELEDLRGMDYSSIATRSRNHTIKGMTYTVSSQVSADTPAQNMKTIATTVSWRNANGPQTYTLNAIYTAIKR
jgi:Tfp pilus assembly protein PilV